MSDIKRFSGRTSLITGAASGIGRALAIALARRGCHLALVDIDVAGLDETAQQVRAAALSAVNVTCHHIDLADAAAVAVLPDAIEQAHGGLDLLINNAGVALGGTFEQIAEEDFDWLFSINFFGTVRMTRAFLPMLRKSLDARIVNMSSLFGLIATPSQTAYTASKFAVRGFSECLRHELADSGIGVTTVHPGGVSTKIAQNARVPSSVSPEDAERHRQAFAAFLKMPPEQAAESIVRAIERRRSRVIIGRDARVATLLERVMPVNYWSVLQRLRRRSERAGAGA